MAKKKAFWFHYNKPESKKRGDYSILTVHYEGKCHLVHDIECTAAIKVRHRKSQPHCVVAGVGVVTIDGDKAVIT